MPSEGADRSRQEELNDDQECVLSDQEVSRPSENSKQEGQLVEEREMFLLLIKRSFLSRSYVSVVSSLTLFPIH